MISKTQSRMRTIIGITLFALLACIIMPLSMETGSVSAATKKPSKVTLTSVSSAGATSISIKWKKAKNAEIPGVPRHLQEWKVQTGGNHQVSVLREQET